MGGHPWFYTFDYDADVTGALHNLRKREFEAGRYNPVIDFPEFPVTATSPSPGAQHASIDEALEDADADGTRSILDMDRVSDEPDYGAVSPLAEEVLLELYGTAKPDRQMVEENMDFLDEVERGQGIYFTIYEDDRPAELLFAGYSFD